LTTIWTKQKAIFYYELNILRSNGSGTVASFSAEVGQLRKLSKLWVTAMANWVALQCTYIKLSSSEKKSDEIR